MGGFVQFDRSSIRERQRDGIALAKETDEASLSSEQVAKLKQGARAGEKKTEIARICISQEALYQYLRQADVEAKDA